MRPYKQTDLGNNQYIREFDSNVDTYELEWHLDKEDRLIDVVENVGGWEVQLDNNLPCLLNSQYLYLKKRITELLKALENLWSRLQKSMNEKVKNTVQKVLKAKKLKEETVKKEQQKKVVISDYKLIAQSFL